MSERTEAAKVAHQIEVIVNGWGQRVHCCHVCGRMGVTLAPTLPCPGPPSKQGESRG